MWFTVGIVLLAALIVLAFGINLYLQKKPKFKDLKQKHVVITGGSSGIGKAAAVEVAKLGAHVTVIGRDVEKLKLAVSEITSKCISEDQKVQYCALDVTSNYATIEKSLAAIEHDIGPIFMLINSAGMCICGQFEEMQVEDIKYMIDLNYFGTAYPTKYVLKRMKERNEGRIVFVSSEAALLGIYGYSAYTAAKCAVRGLAESVFMELEGTDVGLTLSFPADTDTPGFEKEELTKPQETKLISESGGLKSPEEVAQILVRDAMNGKHYSTYTWSGKIMSLLYCASIESSCQVIVQLFSMSILRLIFVGALLSFNKIVRDCRQNKISKKDKKSI